MIKLYQQLESTLKIRINSNDEIILALKRLSEMGKFDKPKELAIFAIILDRLGKMEDEKLVEQSLKEEKTNTAITELADMNADTQDISETTPTSTTETEQPTEQTTPTVTEFNTESITDPQPQNTEPQAT